MSRLLRFSFLQIAGVFLLCSLFARTCGAADIPFVAGFERFARHEQINTDAAGRLLISELSCTRCHLWSDPLLGAKAGPTLSGTGVRLQAAWVRDFVANPARVHPGTTMPETLSELPAEQRTRVASDIAAFLSTLVQDFPEVKATGVVPVPLEFWKRGSVESGQQLYHDIGCVACHDSDPSYEVVGPPPSARDRMFEELDSDELLELGLANAARPVASVPHPALAQKYTQRGLTFFLLNPSQTRPGGRMPSFKLSPVEAADLASYLLSGNEQMVEDAPHEGVIGDVDAGKRAVVQYRCTSCHDIAGLENASKATLPRLEQLRTDKPRACLKHGDETGVAYGLDTLQRDSILVALRRQQPSANSESAVQWTAKEKLDHRLLQLNCYACHEREQLGGVGRNRRAYFHARDNVDLGDEGRLPPPLTGVGQKLTPAWFARVLAGNKADIRPHMTIRMPMYPAREVRELPPWFAAVDTSVELASTSNGSAKSEDRQFIESGRKLMDIGCVQCHQFGGFSIPGVVGVELSGIANRVKKEWFLAFLQNPASLKSGTRMPNFFPGGKSQDTELLGGDPDLQIAAMWSYLKDVPGHSLPQKIQVSRAQTYELVPKNRPVLLRTFMPVAGTHAVAVGMPQGVHYAFDAEQVRLALAWRGRFLDAQGTWFIRFAPPAKPLASPIEFPEGDTLSVLGSENAVPEFGGYRLDTEGVPSFLYRIGGLEVEDRIEPDDNGKLSRTWHLSNHGQTPLRVEFSPLGNASVTALGGNSFKSEKGLTIAVDELPGGGTAAKEVDEDAVVAGRPQQLSFRLEVPTKLTLKATYSW
ncbi:MAG: c-type cytochrome [Aureliella sp.]